ncbi:MAG: phage holin family protein [Agathobacter sp.]|nr:phage holin family protein [Agathobacter sp.]
MENNKATAMKGLVSTIVGCLTSVFGILAIPILLLVVCNVVDYITGIAASKFRGQEISSYKGIRGITKKVCMWLLIIVGAIIDELILYSATQFGLVIPITFIVAAIVAVWLIVNELISILENLKDIGVPMPEFIIKLTKNLKSQIETKADVIPEDESEV